MGLEALPARWHSKSFNSRPSRPFLSIDGVVDGSRAFLSSGGVPEGSDSSRGTFARPLNSSRASPRHSTRASVDGGSASSAGHGLWSDRASKGGPSSSALGSDIVRHVQGHNELSRAPMPFRWKSDMTVFSRRAMRFEESWGEEHWRGPVDDFHRAESAYRGFERLDAEVAGSSRESGGENDSGSSSSSKVDSSFMCFKPQSMFGETNDNLTIPGRASAVDVTAPSFVSDRNILERENYPPPLESNSSSNSSSNSKSTIKDGVGSCISRPASLKRKPSRVCTSQDKSDGKGGLDRPEAASWHAASQAPVGLGILAGNIAIPNPLKGLTKRDGKDRMLAGAGESACSSMKKAFDSMVFMIRTLQSCAFQMRQVFVTDSDVQSVLSLVQRDMQSSFVWLFQQVFSCTPTLMVSVMILLANFTVFSLGNNVAIGAVVRQDPPTQLVSQLERSVDRQSFVRELEGKKTFSFIRIDSSEDPSFFKRSSSPPASTDLGPTSHGSGLGNFGSGRFGAGSVIVAGGEDGDSFSRGNSDASAMFSEKASESKSMDAKPASGHRSLSRDNVSPSFASKPEDIGTGRRDRGFESSHRVEQDATVDDEDISYESLLESTARELELKAGEPHQHVVLDQETVRRLVAPVKAKLEPDNYPCFDRTDLEYQQAILEAPANTMLLVNYAQFLFAVRRDNGRAEEFFNKALRIDAEDANIWARWAIFLWLGRDERARAEGAYRAAMNLDPCNPYHAGSYAHFLWHGEDDDDLSSNCLV